LFEAKNKVKHDLARVTEMSFSMSNRKTRVACLLSGYDVQNASGICSERLACRSICYGNSNIVMCKS